MKSIAQSIIRTDDTFTSIDLRNMYSILFLEGVISYYFHIQVKIYFKDSYLYLHMLLSTDFVLSTNVLLLFCQTTMLPDAFRGSTKSIFKRDNVKLKTFIH